MVDNETLRNRIIRIIAATRFPFVDQEDWGEGYITIVNDEMKRKGIETGTEIVYPSIVITHADGRIQEIGEVEFEAGVNVANVPKCRGVRRRCSPRRRIDIGASRRRLSFPGS